MTDKMKCPFCGAELDDTDGDSFVVCPNSRCKIGGDSMEKIVWQALIDGKKAQGDLTYAKEELECTKHNYSVVSEQKEIAYQNYLKITDDLQKQLQKAQDALNVARNLYEELALSYCQMADDYRTTYGCLKTPEQETQEYMQEYDKEIASITAGGKE